MAKNILIVDDSASIREAVSITLIEAGYNITTAIDGVNALEQLGKQKVDLVISDVNMPNMDGITLVQEIKKLPSYKFMPIIMLTSEVSQKLRDRGKEVGARAWMVKPFSKAKLTQAVATLLTV